MLPRLRVPLLPLARYNERVFYPLLFPFVLPFRLPHPDRRRTKPLVLFPRQLKPTNRRNPLTGTHRTTGLRLPLLVVVVAHFALAL